MHKDSNELVKEIAVKTMELSGLICQLATEMNARGELLEQAIKEAAEKVNPETPARVL